MKAWPIGPAVLLLSSLTAADVTADPGADRAALRRDLQAVTSAPLLARSHWSILIKSLDTGEVIYQENPGKLVMPASNMKILTMAAAAARLGWDYRFETTLASAAPAADGVLLGDLTVRGSGDPSIALRDNVAAQAFDDWARQLQAAGISTIAGRIIGDDSALEDEELGSGWSWDDLAYGYAAPVTGLVFNESLVRVTARPGAHADAPAVITLEPAADHGFTIVNHVVTGPADRPESLDARRERGSATLELTGSVPLGSERAATLSAAVENPTLFFARALRSALIARGIRVLGDAADADRLPPGDPAREATGSRVLATHRSAPLRDLARTFMKVSQNLYGELLVKAVGRHAGEGTARRGQQAIRETLAAWKVPADSYILADGSGLSRMNYVSAEAVVAILERVHADPGLREDFAAALPIGGEDGTLRNRLKAPWTTGQVRAKTGSIANTRALSGYATSRGGERFVFSIVANNFSLPAWRIERVIDLLVEILCR